MEFCLELSDIVVKRGRSIILQFEHVSVRPDEFVGLVGPNGAGKTTFLKLCCGLIKPTRGRVVFGEQRIRRFGRATSAYRRHIGYIPQQTEYNAHLPFTVREIVAMGRDAQRGLGRRLNARDYEIIDFWLDHMGLYDRRRQTFRSLSGGQQQKTLIARAMVAEPRLLIMDEPGANLDFIAKRRLVQILEQLFAENNLTVLVVSHELDLIPTACRRLIVMYGGRILADGDRAQTADRVALAALYAAGFAAEGTS